MSNAERSLEARDVAVDASIDAAAAQVCRCTDGVIEVRIRRGAVVEVRQMEEILAALMSLSEGPTVVLVDARPVKSMTREAQQLIASTASDRDTRAVAILIDGFISVLLGNLFLELAKRVYPTKLFRDPDQARVWLLEHLERALTNP